MDRDPRDAVLERMSQTEKDLWDYTLGNKPRPPDADRGWGPPPKKTQSSEIQKVLGDVIDSLKNLKLPTFKTPIKITNPPLQYTTQAVFGQEYEVMDASATAQIWNATFQSFVGEIGNCVGFDSYFVYLFNQKLGQFSVPPEACVPV